MSVRYRAARITGLCVDQDPPRPAKTTLALMINFMYGTPVFIAHLLPIFSLKSDFLIKQLMLLLEIIHDAGGFVFLAMTDNLSVKQKMFKLLKGKYHQHSLSAITHPLNNILLKYLYLLYDPTRMLKNIRNNWTTEKIQTLEFTDPDSKLDYQPLYPNNFEKQKFHYSPTAMHVNLKIPYAQYFIADLSYIGYEH